MAIGDYAVGKVTPAAVDVNRAAWVTGKQMPKIKYFIPAYSEKEVVIQDEKGASWMKTPWFEPQDPLKPDPEKHYHNLNDLAVVDIENILHIPGVLKYKIDPDDPDEAKKGLYCDINKVVQVSGSGERGAAIKVILEKQTGDPKDKHIIGDMKANIFYILDSDYNILLVLHAYGFTFDKGDKWEIIQHLVYQYNDPISHIVEDDNPFELKTAMEALLPEVIVGDPDDVQKSARADYDLLNFLRDMSSDFSGKRILFLETVKKMPMSDDASIHGNNIRFDMENPEAKLDLDGQTLTIDGDGPHGLLNITDSQGGGWLNVSGENANLQIMARDAGGAINNDMVSFSGSGICVINGRLTSRGGITSEGIISQNLDIESLKVKSVQVNTDQPAQDGEIIAGKLKFSGGEANIAGDDNNLKLNNNVIVDDNGVLTANKLTFSGGGANIASDGDALKLNENLTIDGEGNINAVKTDIADINESLTVGTNADIQGNLTVGLAGESVDAIVNGSLTATEKITLRERSIQFLYQPDRVIMTAGEQNLYAADERILRYDAVESRFKTKNGTPITLSDGDWVMIKSMETLTGHLYFTHSRAKIECERGFRIPLGADPKAVFIQGDNCLADLLVDKSINDLKNLTDMEKRRVIKNQGQGNRISYNREQIFRGGPPAARLDFVLPNHPYLLTWDNQAYEGISRSGNGEKCWFTELYYWLDRRFNKTGSGGDSYETVRVPPREASFLRPVGLNDPDRHSRPAWGDRYETIASGSYYRSGNKITLTGSGATENIKKVKSGCRIRDAANRLLSDKTNPQGTVIVQPGSVDTAARSFKIINAETGAAITAPDNVELKLDFSGMAAGSIQRDAFQGHHHNFYVTWAPQSGSATNCLRPASSTTSIGNQFVREAAPDGVNGDPRISSETRSQNMLAVPYYRL